MEQILDNSDQYMLDDLDLSRQALTNDTVNSLNLQKKHWIKKISLNNNKIDEILLNYPPNIILISLNSNNISSLDNAILLPASLRELYLSDNRLTSIDLSLLVNLEALDIAHNIVTNIKLPPRLKYFIAEDNQLSSFPEIPDNTNQFIVFSVAHNNIYTLKDVVIWTDLLDVTSNQLTVFDISPMSVIEELHMEDNDIYAIVNIPSSVKIWMCNSNRLRSIILHDGLVIVDASDNNLSKCPAFPDSLEVINISNNNLHELNQLPPSIKEVNISGNNISEESIKAIIEFYELTGAEVKIINDQDQEEQEDQDDNSIFKGYLIGGIDQEQEEQEYHDTIELDMMSLDETSHKKKHKFKFTKNLFEQYAFIDDHKLNHMIDDNYMIVQHGRLEL